MEHGKKVGSGEEWMEAWRRLFSKTVVLVSHHDSTTYYGPAIQAYTNIQWEVCLILLLLREAWSSCYNWEMNDGPRVTLMLRGCWTSDHQTLAKCFYHKTLLPLRKHVLPWQQCLTFVLAWTYLEANCSVRDVILTDGYLWLTCAPVCCCLQVGQGRGVCWKPPFDGSRLANGPCFTSLPRAKGWVSLEREAPSGMQKA